MWHNLTNHPAHQDKPGEGPEDSKAGPDSKADTGKKDGQAEPKKPSDSDPGSGPGSG